MSEKINTEWVECSLVLLSVYLMKMSGIDIVTRDKYDFDVKVVSSSKI